MTLTISFPGTEQTTLAEVGGKVYSLILMVEAGLPVPPGAVVAREYGKPCVVGIDQVMTKLHDGQMVEVDGTAGVIRLL